MALLPNNIYQELVAVRASGGFALDGRPFDRMARGIAQGVALWAHQSQNVGLQGLASGSIGAGVIVPDTTRIAVPPLIPVMMQELAVMGFYGPMMSSLAVTVALGISNAFSRHARYAGSVVGVGKGRDVSQVIRANPNALYQLLVSQLDASMFGIGPLGYDMARGLSNGISKLVLSGVGTGIVTGLSGPIFASGTSTTLVV